MATSPLCINNNLELISTDIIHYKYNDLIKDNKHNISSIPNNSVIHYNQDNLNYNINDSYNQEESKGEDERPFTILVIIIYFPIIIVIKGIYLIIIIPIIFIIVKYK